MNSFVIFTDSACDIDIGTLEKWGIKSLPLSFRFIDEDEAYYDNEIPMKEFYDKIREGRVAKTAGVNPEEFESVFEKELKQGKDILYIGFSSGLSTTFNSANIAKKKLSLIYPERKILTVDSLCASAGLGLLLYLASKEADIGATVDEVAAFATSTRHSLCHFFTVEDLMYLMRGGRVSKAKAFFGNMLGIKPILHVDNTGYLVNISKIRGRRLALTMLADMYVRSRKNKTDADNVFISHSDCMEDAEFLASMIKERTGTQVSLITSVGSVIGAHSGPGTLALFFLGDKR